MEKAITVARIVVPIFAAISLGVLARKKRLLTPEEIGGFQKFVMKIGLPCIVFNSCLKADVGVESLSSMVLAFCAVLTGTLWAFRARKSKYPYHNLPQLFTAQETGMLGIPLFMILFGADQAYRMGVLDLAQAVTAYPVIAILSADTGHSPSPGEIVKKVLHSPLTIMCALGLGLNLSGAGTWLEAAGIGGILTDTMDFLSQPVSAMMIFSVGYNFSLTREDRTAIFRISGIHLALFSAFGILFQLVLSLIPGVDMLTRWALLLWSALPASYLAPSLGRTEADAKVASGVCSLLTVTCLAVFIVMAVLAA